MRDAALIALGLAVGFFGAIEAQVIDLPPNWLNARTLASGRVGGTDQEIQECWFSIGSGAMLAPEAGQ